MGYVDSNFSASQLKIMQEGITLIVFVFFSVLFLKEEIKWNYIVSFFLIMLAVFFAFKKFDWAKKNLKYSLFLYVFVSTFVPN